MLGPEGELLEELEVQQAAVIPRRCIMNWRNKWQDLLENQLPSCIHIWMRPIALELWVRPEEV
ncbi:hypothetical protein Tsubulata_036866 [Turnera subulata]|uniref:Uncharacterized protein n=1 Tax=Turnera subulata TaxID=218843 RepID=A0A9Q0JPQ8_9ROSI|nr:hypothetical protein Tsubulata_036866 [Turnera subulata]